jgi:hypothetical protein
MRRFTVPRASTTVAVVAAIVAVLAVMFPGLGFGLSSTSHGGTPTDVYMTQDPEVCTPTGDKIGIEQVQLVPTIVNVGQQSHLLAYFGGMWSGFQPDSTLVLWFEIRDANGVSELSPSFDVSKGASPRGRDLDVGVRQRRTWHVYVQALAALFPQSGAFIPHGDGANIQNCALTVFVNPSVSP